jgi:hypothetical protein
MSDDLINGGGDGFGDGPDWQDWMIIGPLSEDIANEEWEIEKARRDTFGENYLEPEDPATDMDDENIDTDFDFDPDK